MEFEKLTDADIDSWVLSVARLASMASRRGSSCVTVTTHELRAICELATKALEDTRQHRLANVVYRKVAELAEAIEKATDAGLVIDVDIQFNDGSEGIALRGLTEIEAEVGKFTRL